MGKVEYTVTLGGFDSFTSYWLESRSSSMWNCIFNLPPWLEVWWHAFGSGAELYLGAVKQGGMILGFAPLLLRGADASFMGSADVCDYQDFIILPGRETDFFRTLLDDLKKRGIHRMDLRFLRPESAVLSHLVDVARELNYGVSCRAEALSLELDLLPTWEEYLETLTQKQRHEVRRKLRRFSEAGNTTFRVSEDRESALQSLPIFFKLFRESRDDKATFLTSRMEAFFTSLAEAMARAGLLRLGILELNGFPVASVMCFDYQGTVFLYNNGYALQHSSLSAGLISKVFCIRDSIERGRRKFDFLKGSEEYKHRLGGKEVNLYACEICFK